MYDAQSELKQREYSRRTENTLAMLYLELKEAKGRSQQNMQSEMVLKLVMSIITVLGTRQTIAAQQ